VKFFYHKWLWLVYSILAALSWGVWGILTKFISGDTGPFTTHIMFTTGALFTLPLVIRQCKKKDANIKTIIFGVVAGIIVVLGNVSVYQSFKMGGQAAIVIPFTNLYPLVTILVALAVFKEKLTPLNALGIFIVVPAIIIMSGQSEILRDPLHFFRNAGAKSWLIFAFISLILYGLYGASQKVIAGNLTASWSYISFIISAVLVSLSFIALGMVDFHYQQKNFWLGSSAGFLDGLGVLAVFSAYRAGGIASKVSTVAATLQQVFTVFLALVFLNERINLISFTGIVMAILGTYLLSTGPRIIKSKN
jgi:drug/metabolite transporter (DMT)-like permease